VLTHQPPRPVEHLPVVPLDIDPHQLYVLVEHVVKPDGAHEVDAVRPRALARLRGKVARVRRRGGRKRQRAGRCADRVLPYTYPVREALIPPDRCQNVVHCEWKRMGWAKERGEKVERDGGARRRSE